MVNFESDYPEIFEAYESSRFGESHAEQTLRYAKRYTYGPDEMLRDLGPDIHPVKHMIHTCVSHALPLYEEQLAVPGFKEDVSKADRHAYLVGAALHDIGECENKEIVEILGFVVGDILYDLKTLTHSQKEALVRDYIYSSVFPDFSDTEIETIESIIDFDPRNPLSSMFRVAERLGYLETAARAGTLVLGSEAAPDSTDRLRQLSRLAFEVTKRHREHLEDESANYPHLRRRLDCLSPTLDRIEDELIVV